MSITSVSDVAEIDSESQKPAVAKVKAKRVGVSAPPTVVPPKVAKKNGVKSDGSKWVRKAVQFYKKPEIMCVVRDCDNPEQQFDVYKGGCSGEIPEDAFIFETRDSLVKRGYYVHSKTDKLYNVLGIIRKPDSQEFFVLYLGKCYPNKFGSNCYWKRSVEDFHKVVDLPGKEGRVPRFVYRGF